MHRTIVLLMIYFATYLLFSFIGNDLHWYLNLYDGENDVQGRIALVMIITILTAVGMLVPIPKWIKKHI